MTTGRTIQILALGIFFGLLVNLGLYKYTALDSRRNNVPASAIPTACKTGQTEYAMRTSGLPLRTTIEIGQHKFTGCEQWLYKANDNAYLQREVYAWQFYINWIFWTIVMFVFITVMFAL